MAYQSLYRKYRSRDFGDLVGQRHVTQTLANAISSGRVAHAYLFCGPRGTGKTSTARVLAKALNCETGPTATPCDTCAYCRAIKQGSAMDVVEIDAASNRNIDDIRQLREQVSYPPVELRYKFYIVDEVHQLTRDSFNAFLKTLEEPPAHVIFVLCTTDPHQLPATILSRCQRFDFHRITHDEIVERLRWVVNQEGWTCEDEALHLLARTANGGMRDALSLLDQTAAYAGSSITAGHVRDILGGIDFTLLSEFATVLLARDAVGLFTLIDRVMAEGKDVPQLIAELIQYWRNLLRVTIGGAEGLVELAPEQRRELAHAARQSDQAALMRGITLLCEAENELRWNSQQRLVLELSCLRLMSETLAVVTPAPTASRTPTPAPTPAPTPVAGAAASRPSLPEPVRDSPPPAPARQAAAPPAIEAPLPPAPVTGDDHEWTLPRVKRAWPQFKEWMAKSPNLDNLRTRIVDNCWPSSLIGKMLTLTTASAFTRSQVLDRPKVKETLEKCCASFFRIPIVVTIEVQGDAPATPEPVAAPAPGPTAAMIPPPPPTAEVAPLPDPPSAQPAPEVMANHDPVAERMVEVFKGSQEVTG
jgi:DNA polymerase-3 subunit gamma/tau